MPLVVVGSAVLVALAIVFVATTATRRDADRATGVISRETAHQDRPNPALGAIDAQRRHAASGAATVVTGPLSVVAGPARPPPPRLPLDEEILGATRRAFLNRCVAGVMVFSLSGLGATMLGFLWPVLGGGFGSKIKAGAVADASAALTAARAPVYVPEGRLYLQPYPVTALGRAGKIPSYAAALAGMAAGFVALYQKCPHLGCRVPWCQSSQWFECPCHGSKYNRVGEKKSGPAPRGMDRFPVSISGDQLVVDTSTVVLGPPIGTDTTGQQLEGPHCV